MGPKTEPCGTSEDEKTERKGEEENVIKPIAVQMLKINAKQSQHKWKYCIIQFTEKPLLLLFVQNYQKKRLKKTVTQNKNKGILKMKLAKKRID